MKNTTSPVERDDPDRLRERDMVPEPHGGGATETAEQALMLTRLRRREP